jgi:PAS domain S-box-containing protein
MQTWLAAQTPFFVFAGVCVAAFSLQFWWLRKVRFARLPWRVWVLAAVLLGLGWCGSEQAGRREWNRIQNLTENFARLYGDEMENRGHWKLPGNVAGNDPLYLNLIETEKNWEKLNPEVSDIYTLRKLPDGKNVFIVDSETDYNHNGKYDEAREQRKPVGEVYDKVDEGLERAFRGQPNFDFVPITDRWGTWVSVYEPLHDPSGRVEGVLGVDYEAHKFMAAITGAKLRIISLEAFLLLVLLGVSTLNSLLRAQIVERKRTEEELRWKTAFFEAQTNSSIDGILVVDEHGKKILQNRRVADLLKIPQPIADDDDDEKQLRWVANMTKSPGQFIEKVVYLTSNTSEICRDELELKDGTMLDRYSSPVVGKGGKYYGRIWMFRDITERKNTEKILHWQSAALEAAANAIVITDQHGTIQSVNPAFTTLTGYSAVEAVGQNPRILKSGKQDEAFFQNLWQTISSGRVWSGVLTNRRKDGSLYAEEMTITPVQTADGVIARYIAIKQDVTARNAAESLIRQSEDRYRSLIDTARDAIFTIATDGTFTSLNPAAETIGGFSRADWIGKSFAPMVHPDDMPLAREMFNRILTGEQAPVHELRGNPILNRPARMEMTLTAQKDNNGKIIGVLGIGRDITDRKRLEAQLFQSQKMETVGKLAGGIAHEFNSILTAIIGQSELLLFDLPAGSPLAKSATEIGKSAGRAATLTRQLLAYGRRQFLQPEILDLNQLVASMEGLFHLLMGGDVNVQVIPAPGLQAVKADAGQIEQVIVNMVINARDAMSTGGKLTLETANVSFDAESVGGYPDLKPGDYVMLAITDTGMGMSAEVKGHMFEPFFSTKGVGGGAGLGLSTCYGIIKQSGGHINVYSEPGRGTTFKIYLPQVEPQAKISVRHADLPDLPRGTETILLVEDDPALREMAATLLRRLGYTVLAAANGIDALSLQQQRDTGQVDLLFTDVVMPHMNGKELSERVQALYPHTRILFTSAYTENAIVHQGVLGKGAALLQKPFSPSALARKLREVLNQPGAPKPDAARKTVGFAKTPDGENTP